MYNNINNGVTDIPHISIHLFHHYQQIYNAGSYVVSKRSFVTKKNNLHFAHKYLFNTALIPLFISNVDSAIGLFFLCCENYEKNYEKNVSHSWPFILHILTFSGAQYRMKQIHN